MTSTFVLAGIIILSCLLLLRVRYGSRWLMRPFTIFALAAMLYHFGAEVLVRVTGAESPGSGRPALMWLDQGVLVAATTLAVMTVGYVVFGPRKRAAGSVDRNALAQVIDWRVLGVLTVPLLIATTQGRGYITGKPLEGEGVGITGFSAQFFVPLVILTSFGYLLRHPARWLPVVAVQSGLLALAGQRLEVFVGAATLTALAAWVGIVPRVRHIVAVLVLAGVLALGVTSAREGGGRDTFYSDSGVMARLSAIFEGASSIDAVSSASTLVGDAGLRLNSNAWTGGVEQALAQGAAPIGYRPILTSALGVVPSALYPTKLTDLSLQERSVEVWTFTALGMPDVDYLPGHLTFYLGAFGWVGLLAFMGALGAFMGVLEAWVMRSTGYMSALVYSLLIQAALFFEKGLNFYLMSLRTFLVVAVVLWLLAKVRRLCTGPFSTGVHAGRDTGPRPSSCTVERNT